MRAHVIVNPVAGTRGTGRDRRPAQRALVDRVFAEHGATADVQFTEHAGHATALARRAVDQGVDLVVAWGGDGTVNEVAQSVAHSPVALGIVPAGSGNGLARELGIDPRPARALAQAIVAPPRAIDVGEIGGRCFVNVAGIGLDAAIAHAFNARRGRTRGLATYAWLSVVELWRDDPCRYTIEFEGETLDERAALVVVANSAQYGNGARIAPNAQPDDGWLDLVVVAAAGPMATLWRARRLFDGRIGRDRAVTTRRVRRVDITAPGAMRFHVDGEPLEGPARLSVRVHPAALVVKGGRP